MKKGPATRAERLALALRENLKRRKARARALAEAKADRVPGGEAADNTKPPASEDSVERIMCGTPFLQTQFGKDHW